MAEQGLSEKIIAISAKKNEPAWLLDWRLAAYRHWRTLEEPSWQRVRYDPIDYQGIIYYAAPKPKPGVASLDEVDPEVRAMFDKLGISLAVQERLSGVAVKPSWTRCVGGNHLPGPVGRHRRELLLFFQCRA